MTRHYEEFQLEHIKNNTGGFLFRLTARFHLAHCEICRKNLESLKKTDSFLLEIRESISKYNAMLDEEQQQAQTTVTQKKKDNSK